MRGGPRESDADQNGRAIGHQLRVHGASGRRAPDRRAPPRDLIEQLGGRITGSVSRQTDYLVVGEAPGHKLQAARRLGIATLDAEAFRRLVEA
jgi:DNA ligase (NAD+)